MRLLSVHITSLVPRPSQLRAKIWACASHFALATPSPLDMPAWYPLWLDPWQLSLRHSNSATKLPGDSVAQLVRAWQAICQVASSSPSLNHCQFLFPLYFSLYFFLSHWLWLGLRSDCQVWSMSKNLSLRLVLCAHHTLPIGHASLVSASAGSFGWIPGSLALSSRIQPLSCRVTR